MSIVSLVYEEKILIVEIAQFVSPIGDLRVAVKNGRLCVLGFTDTGRRKEMDFSRRFAGLELRESEDPASVISRLRDYFNGSLEALDDIEVDPDGTPFQKRVWSQLRRVQAGQTASYGEIARSIDAPSAVRAVGAANGANPVAIVIPCHRVIGANGKLVGYGGGLERKRWLLAHERAESIQRHGLFSEAARG